MAEYDTTARLAIRRPIAGQPNWATHVRAALDQIDTFLPLGKSTNMKIDWGFQTVALAAARSGVGSPITFANSGFTSATTYGIVCSASPVDIGGFRAVVAGVQSQTATAWTPRIEVADGTTGTTTSTVFWVAVGN